METRPGLAREEDVHTVTPMHMAVQWDKIDVLRVLLEHDWSLGYVLTSNGNPILASAASRGYVGLPESFSSIAQMLPTPLQMAQRHAFTKPFGVVTWSF